MVNQDINNNNNNEMAVNKVDLVVKLRYNGEMRRFRLSNTFQSLLADLELQARSLFSIPASKVIKFTYKDEDGDQIQVSCAPELAEAMKAMPNVILLIVLTEDGEVDVHDTVRAPSDEFVQKITALGIRNRNRILNAYQKFDGDEAKVTHHFEAVVATRKAKRATALAEKTIAASAPSSSSCADDFVPEAEQAKKEEVEEELQRNHAIPSSLMEALRAKGIRNVNRMNVVYRRFNGDEEKTIAFFDEIVGKRQLKEEEPVAEPSQQYIAMWAERGIKNENVVRRVYARRNGDEEQVKEHFEAILAKRKAKQEAMDKRLNGNAAIPQETLDMWAERGIKNPVNVQRVYAKYDGDEEKVAEHFNSILARRKAKQAGTLRESAPQCDVEMWAERGIKNPVNVHRVYARFNGDEEKVAEHFNAILYKRKAKEDARREKLAEKQKMLLERKAKREEKFKMTSDRQPPTSEGIPEASQAVEKKEKREENVSTSSIVPIPLTELLRTLGVVNDRCIERVYNRCSGDRDQVVDFFLNHPRMGRVNPVMRHSAPLALTAQQGAEGGFTETTEKEKKMAEFMEQAKALGYEREWMPRKVYTQCGEDNEAALALLKKLRDLREKKKQLREETRKVEDEWREAMNEAGMMVGPTSPPGFGAGARKQGHRLHGLWRHRHNVGSPNEQERVNAHGPVKVCPHHMRPRHCGQRRQEEEEAVMAFEE